MRARINGKQNSAWLTAALWLALAMLGLLHFGGVGVKWMTLLAGIGVIALLVLGDRKRIWNLPSLLLLGYAAFSWVTIFWAMSGKFHLREWSKILIAVFFFLLVAMHKKFDGAFARRVMGAIAGISAIYALLSIEAVSTGLTKTLLARLPALDAEKIVFQNSRLNGIFGNANIEASIYAIGIFCAIALVCGAEKKWQRILFTVTLSFSAFAFLLVFSMGAIACFIAAVAAYLIFAGKGRSAALLRMLSAAVPTLVCGFIAFALLNSERSALVLALLLANAGVSALLELTVSARLSAVLERHEKLAFGVLIAVALGAAVYIAAALKVTGPYTFGSFIDRSAKLGVGEHTVTVEADGEVTGWIYSWDTLGMLTGERTSLHYGKVEQEVTIHVPEGSEICGFNFSAEPGVTIYRAVIDGVQEIPLNFRLLPGFAANRLQTISASSSPIIRAMYRQDALRLWRFSPVVGNGIGAFETGVTSVQDYPYETRYVHQHYLQVLLEDGVIGLALFAGALAAMLLALWKKRKQTPESQYYWLYPALCAEFVMNGLQMCWDVSMSMIVFLCMTYALYGLIVATCAEPFAEKAAAEENGKKKKAQAKGPDTSLLARNIGIGFTAVVLLTLCGNLYATSKANAPVGSTDEFMSNLSAAARLDLYEHNDQKLSYVVASLNEGGEAYRAQADEYAAQLAGAQSNTIPRYLVGYYLQTEQYDKAIDEAILGASYSASDADTWDDCAALLNEALFQNMLTPLLTEERAALMAKLTEYYDALQAYNASALVPVELSESAQAFFDKIVILNGCMDDDRLFAETLFTA
ncbi:MAG: O-antigen ligase family protein [Oscillospiraceae bacterium]|jgi:membrane protein|nr:O-antigen ligase family protein [Oscillospiraceae bacterium]DAN39551.1 MAG TPA: O-Antigen ligase [Caudoviricetes sp.]